MKKSILATINSIRKSKKKAEVNIPTPTKSYSAPLKSPTVDAASELVTKSALTKGNCESSGKKDKNFNAISKTAVAGTEIAGESGEKEIRRKSRKLLERKIEKQGSDSASAPRKVITPSKVANGNGKMDVGKPKPERDLMAKKPLPRRSSIKTSDEMRGNVISGDAGKRNDSLNQLLAEQEMAVQTVANVGSESTEMTMTDGKPEDGSSGCPLEKVMEFLEAVMIRDYKKSLKLAKEVREYEPNNALVNEYMFVLGGLITADEEDSEAESASEGGSDESSSSTSSSDETSSSDSDGSWETNSAKSSGDENNDDQGSDTAVSSAKKMIVQKVWIP